MSTFPPVYLICGASRGGKSTLATRLADSLGTGAVELDVVHRAAMVALSGDESRARAVSEAVAPALIEQLFAIPAPLVIEGGWFQPEDVQRWRAEVMHRRIVAVCVGYPDAELEDKVVSTKQHLENWLAYKDDAFIRDYLETHIEHSKSYKRRCDDVGVLFVDTSRNFDEAIAEAIEWMLVRG